MGSFLKATREVVFYRVVILALVLFCGWLGWSKITEWAYDNFPMAGNVIIEPKAPKAQAVKRIISPLKYTGLYYFKDPTSEIVIDFKKNLWALRNLHKFNADGQIILRQGRFGLCGDLAVFTYERVRKILDPERYAINYLRVAESGFFKRDDSSHIVLEIVDTQAKPEPVVYVLDPALRRYGTLDTFSTYLPRESYKELDFVTHKIRDQVFKADTGSPVHISRRAMISLYVSPWKGKFDPDNFLVLLAGMKHHDYLSQPLLYFIRESGADRVIEKQSDIGDRLPIGVYAQLKDGVVLLCRRIKVEDIQVLGTHSLWVAASSVDSKDQTSKT